MGWRMVAGWLALGGCAHRAEVSYTEAAQVNLGRDVKNVLVVERVGAGTTGEAVIDAIEGVLSNEGFEGDADTTASAMQGLVDVLGETGRFEITDLRADRGVDPTLFGRELTPAKIAQLCAKSGCDAILSIDALDSDTSATVTVSKEPGETRSFDGVADTSLSATFRVYEADGSVRDQSLVRTGTSVTATDVSTRAEAEAAIAVTPEVQNQLAYDAGAEFGRRIAPHAVMDSRRLYVTGSPELKQAWKQTRAGDWNAATEIWTALLADPDPRLAAKARYNLAVAKEQNDRLVQAQTLAREAASALDNQRTRNYVAALDVRIENRARVKEQMGDTGRRTEGR